MEAKSFKNSVAEFVKKKGFIKKGSSFRKDYDDLVCTIGLQRSSYSEGYYIEIGYIIRKLKPSIENPRYTDGDVRSRFEFEKGGKSSDFFEPNDFDEAKLDKVLNENFVELVNGVSSVENLKELLNRSPLLLYQTTLKAKQFLGFSQRGKKEAKKPEKQGKSKGVKP